MSADYIFLIRPAMTREKDIYKVTLLGSVGNLLLMAFKFLSGILAHSSAMIADAVHSASDFLTDIVVIVFVGLSARPKDKDDIFRHVEVEMPKVEETPKETPKETAAEEEVQEEQPKKHRPRKENDN